MYPNGTWGSLLWLPVVRPVCCQWNQYAGDVSDWSGLSSLLTSWSRSWWKQNQRGVPGEHRAEQGQGTHRCRVTPDGGERNNFTLFPQNLYFTIRNVILISPLLAGWLVGWKYLTFLPEYLPVVFSQVSVSERWQAGSTRGQEVLDINFHSIWF